MTGSITTSEASELRRLEVVVRNGMGNFLEVGHALQRIRDGRLYRASHATFEAYCRERWSLARNYANKLIASTSVVETLGTVGTKPINERQARALTVVPPDKRGEVWQRAVATAPDGRLTARHVRDTVDDFIQEATRLDPKGRRGRTPSAKVENISHSLFAAVSSLEEIHTKITNADRAKLRVYLKRLMTLTRFTK